jgi:hypothetical protein
VKLRRQVGARLVLQVQEPAELVLQVAVSGMPGLSDLQETLEATLDGEPLKLTEVAMPGNGRAHIATTGPGEVTVTYGAVLQPPD